jgi:hypothetical protein
MSTNKKNYIVSKPLTLNIEIKANTYIKEKIYNWIKDLYLNNIIFVKVCFDLSYDDDRFGQAEYTLEKNKRTESCIQHLISNFSCFDFIDCCAGKIEICDEQTLPQAHFILGFRQHFNSFHIIESLLLRHDLIGSSFSFLKNQKDLILEMDNIFKKFTNPSNNNLFIVGCFSYWMYAHGKLEEYSDIDWPFLPNIEIFLHLSKDLRCKTGEERMYDSRILSYFYFHGLHREIDAIPLALINDKVYQIVFYLGIILECEKIIIFNNKIYKKIQQQEIRHVMDETETIGIDLIMSYQLLYDKIDSFLENDFLKLMSALQVKFWFIDPVELSIQFFNNKDKVLEQFKFFAKVCSTKTIYNTYTAEYYHDDQNTFSDNSTVRIFSNIITNKILNQDIREHTDGIYLEAERRFISNKDPELKEISTKYFTTNFVEKPFQRKKYN